MAAGFGGLGCCMAYQVAEVFTQRMVRMPGFWLLWDLPVGPKRRNGLVIAHPQYRYASLEDVEA